jgi:quercetin dioxygenase-like cupin family protein
MDKRRRSLLLGASGGALASLAAFRNVHAMQAGGAPGRFRKMGPGDGVTSYAGVHEGKGTIDVHFFFGEDEAPKPALLLTYTIPPGASEGVHTHRPGDQQMGSFDEFYYIMEGSGEMEIEGERVPVRAGDHVFTPNGVAHGIENTAKSGNLKVYLVAMIRD